MSINKRPTGAEQAGPRPNYHYLKSTIRPSQLDIERVGLIFAGIMNNPPADQNQGQKIKYHVTFHSAQDGQVRIEFRRWPGDLIARFSSTVPQAQVAEELENFQGYMEKDEERQEEIGRKLYGADYRAE